MSGVREGVWVDMVRACGKPLQVGEKLYFVYTQTGEVKESKAHDFWWSRNRADYSRIIPCTMSAGNPGEAIVHRLCSECAVRLGFVW